MGEPLDGSMANLGSADKITTAFSQANDRDHPVRKEFMRAIKVDQNTFCAAYEAFLNKFLVK